ncbi:MAG: enoyl-CoA hydratase/isomerase family protein [Elusimicrobia bacterium]|nr:enoyl-CoA hydratase/isomerase family protein [Elusimicrobiota bacterium]
MSNSTVAVPVELIKDGAVACLYLNRPDVLNALSDDLIKTLADRLEEINSDDQIGCAVIFGRGRAFAAGADIKGMARATQEEMQKSDRLALWNRLWKFQKPLIAAVHGFALGGGCELAMGCDIIIAAEDAEFGQPEILIGVMPGAGGTQRLARAIGKYRAMEIILTGQRFSAQNAHDWGLVNRVVPKEILESEARGLARRIASQPRLAVLKSKEAILRAQDVELAQGLTFERQLFYSLFSTCDQKEGMAAFLEKRPPQWKNK